MCGRTFAKNSRNQKYCGPECKAEQDKRAARRRRGMPLDEAVFYDTGMEFDAIYAERDRMPPLLRENGIRYVELRPKTRSGGACSAARSKAGRPAKSTSTATAGAAARAAGARPRSCGR